MSSRFSLGHVVRFPLARLHGPLSVTTAVETVVLAVETDGLNAGRAWAMVPPLKLQVTEGDVPDVAGGEEFPAGRIMPVPQTAEILSELLTMDVDDDVPLLLDQNPVDMVHAPAEEG